MDKNQISWNEKAAQQIILNLEKRRMEGSYAATAAQAIDEVLAMIPRKATVYRCGSITTTSMGLWKKIASNTWPCYLRFLQLPVPCCCSASKAAGASGSCSASRIRGSG